MERTQMEDFVANAALLAGHLTRQCEQAAADQRDAAKALRTAAVDVADHAAAGRDALLHATTAAVRDTLTGQLKATTARAESAAQHVEHLIAQLEHVQSSLAGRSRLLSGGALLALVVAGVAVTGASAYVVKLNLERADRVSVRADVLEALQHVAITACDHRPCIKMHDGLARWPSNQDYVFVDTPPVAP